MSKLQKLVDLANAEYGEGTLMEWRDIPGYEGYYQASNLGDIRSLDRKVITGNQTKRIKGVVLKPHRQKNRYLHLELSKYGYTKDVLIHRLVAQAFIPNPENKPQVNHIDGVKVNNKVRNLEWCTNKENHIEASRLGLKAAGERHGMSKLHLSL